MEIVWKLILVGLLTACSAHSCRNTCGNMSVRFPFGIDDGCGDPWHKLQCENGTLNLPYEGPSGLKALVFGIDYVNEEIHINTSYSMTYSSYEGCDMALNGSAYKVNSIEGIICAVADFPEFQLGACLYNRQAWIKNTDGFKCYNYTWKVGNSSEKITGAYYSYAYVPWIVKSDRKQQCAECDLRNRTCGYTGSTNDFVCIKNGRSVGAAIIGGTVGGSIALLLLLAGVSLWILHKRISIQNYKLQSLHATRTFSYKELVSITSNFKTLLGEGGFGSVFFGVLPDKSKVAVKRLQSSKQGHKEFVAEVMTVGSIHHFNLVHLRGYCAEGDHRLLVYDHVPNGSLDKWLFKEGDEKGFLEWRSRLQIATGTARALAYLHEECEERIIHLDVKPQNILLDEHFNAKVCDFGMSTLMSRDESSVFTTMRGTRGYLAPEWLQYEITEKVDVYSYGVVLLELVSGEKCLDFRRAESSKWSLASWATQKVEKGEKLLDDMVDVHIKKQFEYDQAIMEQVETVVQIAVSCIQDEPAKRPSMSNIVHMLEGSVAADEQEQSCNNLEDCFTGQISEGSYIEDTEILILQRQMN